MKKVNYLFSALLFLVIFSLSVLPVLAVTFNPNHIISDEEMTDASTMTMSEIDSFLKSKGGYISNHNFADRDGNLKSAANIIYRAANNYDCGDNKTYNSLNDAGKRAMCKPATINPKLLLVLLQKEQSLIEEKNPTQRQLDWATGYGCPDGGGCDPYYRGFGKQVNSAALQFSDYMDNPQDWNYLFQVGKNYSVTNTGRPPITVTMQNQATVALYIYTPHVYNGNYNFFKLWTRYFNIQYPNNSLLQAKGEVGVWLIQNGQRRPFLTRGALTSRFDINKVIQVNKTDLEKYTIGDPLKFPQYSLVRSPRGTVFLIVDDKRRGFKSAEAFRKIGYNPEEIIDAAWEDINAYEETTPLTATSTYPTGALLQDKTTGGIYYVTEGTKAPLWDAVLLKTRFRGRVIIAETPEKLASYRTVEPAIYHDGELIKSPAGAGVYVIDNGQKRLFTSGEVFLNLGYRWDNIITVPEKILALYGEGTPIVMVYEEEEEIEIIDPNATSTPDVASTTTGVDEDLAEEINDILNP